MSDDEVFHFNINDIVEKGIVTEIIGNICKALNCTPDEIMEFYDA